MESKKGNKAVWGFKRRTALTVFIKRLKRKEGESYLEFLSRGRKEYAALPPEEKKKLSKEAATLAFPKTMEEKQLFMKQLERQFKEVARVLLRVGAVFYFEVEIDKINYTAAHDNLPRHVFAKTPPLKTPSKITHLRQCVQKVFNDSYGRALGKEDCHSPFPYKKHRLAPVVTVTGMPDGVPFKHPSNYGASKLKKILANKALIKMELIAPSATEVIHSSVETDIFMASDRASGVENTMAQDIVAQEPSPCAAEVIHSSVETDMEEAPTNPLQLSTVMKKSAKQHQQSREKSQRTGFRSLWTAAEILVVQQHFSQELAGLKPVARSSIDSFLAQQTVVKRTATALGNYLLRNRKKIRPNDQQ
ncbi:general transcription factor II-I repeat domain-containing protein 1-like isoform X2 [Pomacea canaliculata]|uniref:general transcription factor II-I repeat domain-containing protein 1-like isoform X2 n=1 Tax=Pomacea canaliculata TaxID=400727 RepID=UPI000D732A40|nr:general transcription factor II-I repeat domain-containing protein 1-like isoform X2 [Pomacea canaliculata]